MALKVDPWHYNHVSNRKEKRRQARRRVNFMDYAPLNDFDDSFLPVNFFRDELIPLDNEEKICYTCDELAMFYNATVGRYECELHTDVEEKETA